MRRLASPCLVVLWLALAVVGCDRNVEPFTDDPVSQPDLSRIFPEGAERAAQEASPSAPPAAPSPAPAAGPGGGGASLTGTIRLAPELAGRVPAGAVLFLIARSAETGPPVAVQRIAAPRFPLAFEIGPGDRMMEGVPFEAPLRLTARIDADQNAMTRNPGDLQGSSAPGLAPGARDVEIEIDEVL